MWGGLIRGPSAGERKCRENQHVIASRNGIDRHREIVSGPPLRSRIGEKCEKKRKDLGSFYCNSRAIGNSSLLLCKDK